jgi:hypothetical protein
MADVKDTYIINKEKTMKKAVTLFICVFGFAAVLGAQNVTNNNTITINGNVYYFKPATTPSSPQPRVGASDFISYGRWYGADAAKAWASIADWAIEHCEKAGYAVTAGRGERVYISSVEAGASDSYLYKHKITIYYWVVGDGRPMEDGGRRTRIFWFK